MGIELATYRTELAKIPAYYEEVRNSNPLGVEAEKFLCRMPDFNNPRGVDALIPLFSEAVRNYHSQTKQLSLPERDALTRDLSLPASVLTRYGYKISVVPGLVRAFVENSKFTGKGPIWTVWEYANGNPKESKRGRRLTEFPEESLFIECLSNANTGWLKACELLVVARELSVIDPDFTESVTKANKGFDQARIAMAKYVKVDTDFFNKEIAINFQDIVVGEKKYRNASGAGGGLLAAQTILKGYKDQDYVNRHLHELPHLLRTLVETSERPLIEKVKDEIKSLEDARLAIPGLNAVVVGLKLLKQFDGMHYVRAKTAMSDRGQNVGTGGESAETLEDLGKDRNQDYEELHKLLMEFEQLSK